MYNLPQIIRPMQYELFPTLISNYSLHLTSKVESLIYTLELLEIEKYVRQCHTQKMGRPFKSRCALVRAFVVQHVYNVGTVTNLRELIINDRNLYLICGYGSPELVPSLATFSRAFDEFSKIGLGDIVLSVLNSKYRADYQLMHTSIDSTAIEVREKPSKSDKPSKKQKKKRGRPCKGEFRPEKEPVTLEIQKLQSEDEIIRNLHKHCTFGTKKGSKGKIYNWIGYKAHIAWGDGMLPLCVITTAASTHDSQVAIPLMQKVSKQFNYYYDLFDSAYDARIIREVSEQLNHKPLIDPNKRRGDVPEERLLDPSAQIRYKERTNAERGNSRLKDEFGLRNIRFRGHAKVHLYVMFSVLCLYADQVVKHTLQ